MKWMSSPSISVMKCGRSFSLASHLRQSWSVAQYRARSCIIASRAPCESSATVSTSGHLVAFTRLRRSVRSASGKPTVNGRMVMSSAGIFLLLTLVGDVDDGLGECLRSLLRQVVPDAAGDGPVRVRARELRRVGAGFRMGCAVGVTFEGDRRHGDVRAPGQVLFEVVVL